MELVRTLRISFSHSSTKLLSAMANNSYRSENVATAIKNIASHQCEPCSGTNHGDEKMLDEMSFSPASRFNYFVSIFFAPISTRPDDTVQHG